MARGSWWQDPSIQKERVKLARQQEDWWQRQGSICSELWKRLICCTFFPVLLVADCCLYNVFVACDSADRKCTPYCHHRRKHDNIDNRQYFIILPIKEVFYFHGIHGGFPKRDRPSPKERFSWPSVIRILRSWLTWHARRSDCHSVASQLASKLIQPMPFFLLVRVLKVTTESSWYTDILSGVLL